MTIDIAIDAVVPDHGVFLGWTPRQATVTLNDIPAGSGPIPVQISSTGPVGRLIFTTDRAVRGTSVLDLTVDPAVGSASFFVSGEFNWSAATKKNLGASVSKDDAQVTATAPGADPATLNVTVRVRKNANALEPEERDRFLKALEMVNKDPQQAFQTLRDMHRDNRALDQAHNLGAPRGNAHFLPWHRAYMLDLERHLQKVDPTVTLPYWQFDEAASKVFHPDFMGRSDQNGVVSISPSNPLTNWSVDGLPGFSRSADFDQISASPFTIGNVADEVTIMDQIGDQYGSFRNIEGFAHNGAHSSFFGLIGSANTAPMDPLFFLLHCNVDRLWALWQWRNNRYNKTATSSYNLQGASARPPNRVGRMSQDTMWPWDNLKDGERPTHVPRQPFPQSPTHAAPGLTPTIESMIDYQGQMSDADDMGFDYDSVPFYRGGA